MTHRFKPCFALLQTAKSADEWRLPHQCWLCSGVRKSLSKATRLFWLWAVKRHLFHVVPRWPKAWPISFPLESFKEFSCIWLMTHQTEMFEMQSMPQPRTPGQGVPESSLIVLLEILNSVKKRSWQWNTSYTSLELRHCWHVGHHPQEIRRDLCTEIRAWKSNPPNKTLPSG